VELLTVVLASKVHPIPLKFLSKEGHNSAHRHFKSYLAAWPLVCDVISFKETSGQVTWALGTSQAAKYDLKWWHAELNFGPLWRGISVGWDALYKLKPQSVTQLSVIFLSMISKNTPFLE